MAYWREDRVIKSSRDTLEFEEMLDGIDLQIRGGYVRFSIGTELLAKHTPYMHEFFNAEDAIEHMSSVELEKLRFAIAPEITKLNTQLEERIIEENKHRWEQLNTLRDGHRMNTTSLNDKIQRLEKRAIVKLELTDELTTEIQRLKDLLNTNNIEW